MKELTIEEKARRYDEAIERAKELLEIGLKDTRDKRVVLSFFPELAESKDESIRKAMIKYFTNGKEYLSLTPYSREDYIAWLEKQGNLVKHYEDKLDRCACDNFNKGYKKALEKQGEKKPIIEMKSAEESLGIDSETYNKIVDECIYGEQKPWSEEDENIIVKIKTKIAQCNGFNKKNREEMFSLIDSLRPQSTWKPSEEEMKALEFCLEHNIDKDGVFGSKVVKLYDELKKLKG